MSRCNENSWLKRGKREQKLCKIQVAQVFFWQPLIWERASQELKRFHISGIRPKSFSYRGSWWILTMHIKTVFLKSCRVCAHGILETWKCWNKNLGVSEKEPRNLLYVKTWYIRTTQEGQCLRKQGGTLHAARLRPVFSLFCNIAKSLLNWARCRPNEWDARMTPCWPRETR